jgi:aspartate/methionine/tyrosine aminotransferase
VGTQEIFAETIEFAKQHQIIVVNDFAYGDLGLDGYRPISILSMPDAKAVGIEIFSLSKGHSMAGWRIGTVVGHSDAVDRYFEIKTEVDCGTFEAVQAAGVAALSPACDLYVAEARELYARRHNLVCAAFEAGGISVFPQKATPYVWSPIPSDYVSCETFAQYVLEQTGVTISLGWVFGPNGLNHFRVSLLASEERLQDAANRISTLPQ